MLSFRVFANQNLRRPLNSLHFPLPLFDFPSPTKLFKINTYKSLSKQRTLTSFRMNTYEKQGGGGLLWLTSPLPSSNFPTYLQPSFAFNRFHTFSFSVSCNSFISPPAVAGHSYVGCRVDTNSSPFGSPRAPRGTLLHLHFGIRHLFSRHRFQFPTHYVRGKPRPQQAPIQGSQLLFVEFPAEGAQLPFDALAHHRTLIRRLGSFVQRRFNMPVRNPSPPQVARNPEFSLLARFRPLPRELLRIPRVIDHPVFFQARHHQLHQQFVVAAPLELFLHFMDGMSAAHQCAHRDIVEFRFRFELARPAEHRGRIEVMK